jgi:hypothetical protein
MLLLLLSSFARGVVCFAVALLCTSRVAFKPGAKSEEGQREGWRQKKEQRFCTLPSPYASRVLLSASSSPLEVTAARATASQA